MSSSTLRFSESLGNARCWGNRVLALLFRVPALPYFWLEEPEQSRQFTRSTINYIVKGRDE